MRNLIWGKLAVPAFAARNIMRKLGLGLAAAALAACAGPPTGTEPQRLVDRAALSVLDILSS